MLRLDRLVFRSNNVHVLHRFRTIQYIQVLIENCEYFVTHLATVFSTAEFADEFFCARKMHRKHSDIHVMSRLSITGNVSIDWSVSRFVFGLVLLCSS